MNPLARMLAEIVDHRLEGAACTGEHHLFDPRADDETQPDYADRADLARMVCGTCPVLNACHGVAQNMRPNHRAGTWAGIPYDSNGRPVRHKENPR